MLSTLLYNTALPMFSVYCFMLMFYLFILVFICSAVFLSQIGYMIESNINDCLDLIYRRLTNELTRLAAVRAIQIIASYVLCTDYYYYYYYFFGK